MQAKTGQQLMEVGRLRPAGRPVRRARGRAAGRDAVRAPAVSLPDGSASPAREPAVHGARGASCVWKGLRPAGVHAAAARRAARRPPAARRSRAARPRGSRAVTKKRPRAAAASSFVQDQGSSPSPSVESLRGSSGREARRAWHRKSVFGGTDDPLMMPCRPGGDAVGQTPISLVGQRPPEIGSDPISHYGSDPTKRAAALEAAAGVKNTRLGSSLSGSGVSAAPRGRRLGICSCPLQVAGGPGPKSVQDGSHRAPGVAAVLPAELPLSCRMILTGAA